MTYKVLIVGAGTKGAFYDRPGDEKVLSHAHAFTLNPAFEVVGFVDPDLKKAELACERWNAPMAYTSLGEVREPVDVIVVATPDKTQFSVLLEVLQLFRPQLVICEKPFCGSWLSAKRIEGAAPHFKTPILINYTRRFCLAYQQLARAIKRGTHGEFLTGAAFYGNGILHSASHWIDLFWFLGIPPRCVRLINVERAAVNTFEATLLFNRAKIEIRNHGDDIWISPIAPRSDFPSEYLYAAPLTQLSNCLSDAMSGLVQSAESILLGQEPDVNCTVEDAIRVHDILERHGYA